MKKHLLSLFALAAMTIGGPAVRAEDAKPAAKPIKVLLVLGGCCHDYAKQKDILAKGLAERANVDVTIAYDKDNSTKHLNAVYDNADWSKGFDVIVHDECSSDVKDSETVARILAPHKKGLPAVNLHCAMHCYRSEPFPNTTPWMEFTGLNTKRHGAQLPIAITFTDKQSPITKGMENWTTIHEEQYHQESILPTAKPLATGEQGKDKDTVIWTNDYHGARVFSTTLGHNNETVSDPRYLDLVTRGLLWAVDKLDENGKPKPGYEGMAKAASAK
ncbi:MAG TPA: ThuA domain-containing protein [Tepidisphaeraceae bacterium]|jgi:type 1 glutamine amidotransferase|nr:ThuA domain-containing protein [Tepidisphaeraceae bacterium]